MAAAPRGTPCNCGFGCWQPGTCPLTCSTPATTWLEIAGAVPVKWRVADTTTEPVPGGADLGHLMLAVPVGDQVGRIVGRIAEAGGRHDRLRAGSAQGGLVPSPGPNGVTQQQPGHAEQPWQGRVRVEHDLAPSSPGLQEHRRREVLGR